MNRAIVVAFVAFAALAACGSSSHNNAPVVDAFQGSGASCATLTSGITDFETGVDGTPSGFPSPPSGLVLCGVDPMSNSPGAPTENWYLAGSLSMSDVFDYYQTQLTTAGFTVETPIAEPNGNTKLVYTNATTSGAVIFNSTELFVLVSFPT
ncbi:MAG TPA: hypothetical protein VH143_02150 [Kofleriaceae bacterium]|nr:hypothetical protein [Kofleriaceae bacterium]